MDYPVLVVIPMLITGGGIWLMTCAYQEPHSGDADRGELTRGAARVLPARAREAMPARLPARHAAALLVHRCSSPPHVAHRCRPAWST